MTAPDPRFFESLGPATLGELAALTGSRLADGARASDAISAVAILSRGAPGAVTFCADRKFAPALAATGASACFLTESLASQAPPRCAAVISAAPQAAYAMAAERLHRPRGWDATPGVHPSAELEDGVVIAPGVTVGAEAAIGRGTRIAPGASIGPGVSIGRDCQIGANAVIGFALIGDRVKILAGAVIGEAGFGATGGARGVIDVPQLGRVIIQDDVTIGAVTCVDRGAFDDTVIGENTKIDNQVQIAHNVSVGRNCVIAAQTGVSGSVTIGDGCMLGGRVGVADHIDIGPGARLAAWAGVTRNVPAGQAWGGFPARPVRTWLRETVWTARAAARREGDEP